MSDFGDDKLDGWPEGDEPGSGIDDDVSDHHLPAYADDTDHTKHGLDPEHDPIEHGDDGDPTDHRGDGDHVGAEHVADLVSTEPDVDVPGTPDDGSVDAGESSQPSLEVLEPWLTTFDTPAAALGASTFDTGEVIVGPGDVSAAWAGTLDLDPVADFASSRYIVGAEPENDL